MDTVNIGPYLHLVGIYCRANQCCSVVAAATLQVIVAALMVHADKALRNVYLALLLKIDKRKKMLAYVAEVGLTVYRKAHEIKRIEQLDIIALLLHVYCYHVGRDNLSLSNNLFLQFIVQRLECKVAKMGEYSIHLLCCSLGTGLCPVEVLYCLHVLRQQICRMLAGSVHITVTEIVSELYERICCSRHCRKNDNLRLSVSYKLYNTLHALGRTDRCAAKFQYFHIYIFILIILHSYSPDLPLLQ